MNELGIEHAKWEDNQTVLLWMACGAICRHYASGYLDVIGTWRG